MKFDASEISPKDLANIAKDAETSLWWQCVENWLNNTLQEAQYQKDMAEDHTSFVQWKSIEKTIKEILAIRTTVMEMAKQQTAISKDNTDRRFLQAQNKGE